MNESVEKRLQAGALAVCLAAAGASGAAWAQNAPPGITPGDPRNTAQEELYERTQDDAVFQELQEQSKRGDDDELDRDEAAAELEATDKKKSSGILAKLPSEENLRRLLQRIQAEPNNLDHYFAFARMASQLGLYDKAAQTYEFMLKLAPNLHRVRLDLGAAYLRLGRFKDAKRELDKVLATNPPPQVQANIEQVLAKVDHELSEHDINGLISVGINLDSNGNSAAESDSIVIFDTVVPLSAAQRAQQDVQFFASLGVNHSWRPKWAQSETFARRWKTSVNGYRAEQSSLEELDLQVYSLKTGPEFQSKQSGIKLSPSITRSQIVLDEQTYLRNTALAAKLDYPVTPNWLLSLEGKAEFREFENSSDVSTYEDRTGSATQWQAATRYAITEQDYLNAAITHRRERARVEYFDNEQIGATLGYTRILPEGFFASATLGYKNTVYDDNDPLISRKTRHDKQTTAGLTLGKKITDDVTATIGYQFRDVNSNIRNYEYNNHRYSAGVSYRF